jgi:hypothetical protein
MANISFHSMVAVPGQGLFIYGGEGNTLTTAQKLTSITGAWTTGPPLYLNQAVRGQCIVQVTLFFRTKMIKVPLALLTLIVKLIFHH